MNISAIPLSNDDEAVIRRTLSVKSSQQGTVNNQIEHVYEIARTVDEITSRCYKRLALQFPDDLLVDAASVVAQLRSSCAKDVAFYVLGDTSYGSCCVDEVAAEHVDADALVHYGRSCLSPTSKLPVIYVFGRLPISVEKLVTSAHDVLPDRKLPLLVVSDTTYMSSQDSIVDKLRCQGYRHVIPTTLWGQTTGSTPASIEVERSLPGREYSLPDGILLSSTVMLYIGPPSPTLTTTLMTHSSLVSAIYSYHPQLGILKQETSQNIALRRRYATVQKARDAGVIGIVVGTLGVSRYLDLIKHLRTMISVAGKKSYLFAMGKLNPSKMANFSEIDAFVLVACGENSLIESRDFYKPVVTPFELSLALQTGSHDAVPWTGDWVTDFERVLAIPKPSAKEHDSDQDEEAPHFSLVTGAYSSSKPMYAGLETATDADSALTKRSSETALGMVGGLFSPAAHHLRQRQHWGGLGTDADRLHEEQQDSVVLTQGRSGVARGYLDQS